MGASPPAAIIALASRSGCEAVSIRGTMKMNANQEIVARSVAGDNAAGRMLGGPKNRDREESRKAA